MLYSCTRMTTGGVKGLILTEHCALDLTVPATTTVLAARCVWISDVEHLPTLYYAATTFLSRRSVSDASSQHCIEPTSVTSITLVSVSTLRLGGHVTLA